MKFIRFYQDYFDEEVFSLIIKDVDSLRHASLLYDRLRDLEDIDNDILMLELMNDISEVRCKNMSSVIEKCKEVGIDFNSLVSRDILYAVTYNKDVIYFDFNGIVGFNKLYGSL